MNILDSLKYGNQGGYGGLLDMLMYRGQQDNGPPLPEYDLMGTPFRSGPQPTTSPFPELPAANYSGFAPAPGSSLYSPFNQGATPVAGLPQAAPPLPPAQDVAPVVQPPAPPNMMPIGKYNMPQIGSVAEYTPQSGATDFSSQNRAPPQMQTPQGLPPAFETNPGGLGAGLRGFMNNLHTGPLGAIMGGIGSAAGMQSDEKQNLSAQYKALIPLLGSQKAMIAVMNPKMGDILLAQAGEKKKFEFIKTGDDTVLSGDATSGKVNVVHSGSDSNSAGVAGPDGKMIPYPEGMNAAQRKTFANHIAGTNADAATGKMTESQGKAAGFATRMMQSVDIIKKVEGQGQNISGRLAENAPFGGAYLQSPEYQRYTAAKQSFINAHLRKDSGASIHDPEFIRAEKEFFPQPGEGATAVREKAARREALTETTKREAGPAFKLPTTAEQTRVRKYNPATGAIE